MTIRKELRKEISEEDVAEEEEENIIKIEGRNLIKSQPLNQNMKKKT